jgi:L-lysine 6-transaminase
MKKLTKDQIEKLTPQQVHEVLNGVMLADGYPVVVDLDRSNGMILYDSRENKPYLDFFSYFASNPIGHNHPKMSEPGFLKKLQRASVNNPSNSDFYTVEMAQFVATFHKTAMPESMQHLFLVSGGGPAVENALKVAMDWKVRKNKRDYHRETGTKVVHLANAFHGRLGYSMSLTNTADPRKYMYYAQFDWPRISSPAAIFPLEGKNLEATIAAEEKALKELKHILKLDAQNICSILIEPIQGEGGDRHFRPEFLKGVKELCLKFDIMLIYDEVQCGMGLTGNWWAWQALGVEPDIFAFGKKSQVCGIVAGPRVDEIENNVFAESSRINSTWGGNLSDMVRAQRYLEIIEEENLLDNATKMGKILLDGLCELEKKHKSVTNARGRGLMCAFDVPLSDYRTRFLDLCFEKGLIILPCGTHSIRFRPSLNVDKESIGRALAIIDEAIRELK